MAITLRTIKGTALTHVELDGNFSDLDSRINDLQTDVDNIPGIGSADVNFGSYKILYSNTVTVESDLSNLNPNTYAGMTILANDTGALYYAQGGAWRKLITDMSYGNPSAQGYVSPLATIAYTGSYNDLIDVPPAFSFDGSYTSLTDKPTIPQDVSELADINNLLFSGSYDDLINKPAIATATSQLTNDAGFITISSVPTALSELSNDTNFITIGDVPAIPSTLTDLGITDGTIGQVLSTDGNGNFTFVNQTGGSGVGNFTLAASVIDTDDSSAITITPATIFSSDVTVENDLIVNNKIICDEIQINQTGNPTLTSESTINISAADRVYINRSPLNFASFTSAERDALTAINGDMIYNSENNRFEAYVNGAWVIIDHSPIV